MLSTNSSSSIQARRKLHRRQQSLEVPILAAPLPANPRRNQQPHQAHRRGLSLDQSLSALQSPTGFRPLPAQDHIQHPQSGSPSVRIQLDTTNLGHPSSNQQHFVQATQQQRPAQPGYPAQDFQAHLQQQLGGHGNVHAPLTDLKPSPISAPSPIHPSQQLALQELQQHMEWYQSTFAHAAHPATAEMTGSPMPMPLPMPQHQQQVPYGVPRTPLSHGHSRTVPNTPQSYANNLPSPPPTHGKLARSQSFQLDVAPMPVSFTGGLSQAEQTTHDSFGQDAMLFANDQSYASSAYSSSVVDPMSPCGQYNQGRMPTLFEEPSPPLGVPVTQGGFSDSSLLGQATSGAAQDFNDPDFDFGGAIALSPNQALLSNLGPDVPASIVDTGIQSFEVQRYIGELSDDNKYPCLFEGCNRRFGRKENVRAHVQTHLGDRQFRCNLCEKTFVRQHDLKRHVAIHSTDRPFVCPCGTGFARHDALTRHRQRGMCHGALPGFEKNEEEKPKRGRPKKQRPDMEARVEKATRTRKNNKQKVSEAPSHYASSSSGGSDRSFPVTPPNDSSDAFDADAFLALASADHPFDDVTASWRDTPPTSPVSASPTKTVDSFDPSNTHQTFDFNAPLDQGISPSVLSNYSSSPAAEHHAVSTAHSTPQQQPTSFDYASPTASASFHGGSSPSDIHFFNDADATALHSEPNPSFDAYSPPGESNMSSSVYNSDGDADPFGEFTQAGATSTQFAKPSADLLSGTNFSEIDIGGRSLAEMLDEWITTN